MHKLVTLRCREFGTSVLFLKKRVLLLLLFCPVVVYSQQIKLSGYITDNSGQPIQYVNIVTLSKFIGAVTDEKGYFTISAEKKDSVKLSHIAFLTRIISVNELSCDTIILNPSFKSIAEVIVKSSNSFHDKSKIGFYNKDNNGEFLLKPGNQIAVFIDNPKKKPALIQSVTFEVKRKGKCYSPLRLRILENLDNKIIPGQDLLKENYIIENSLLTKSNTIDISKSKVFLPTDGIFIVVEWIGEESNCEMKSFPTLGANISTKENLVWYNFRDKQWNKPKNSPLPNGNFMTPNVSLKVYY